jgi:hypothetical protein
MADSRGSRQERTKHAKLSTKGLENVALVRVNDFTLQVGSETFECSRFEAAFISPRIAAILLQDPTIDKYEVDIEVNSDEDIGSECVNGLISLSRNSSLEVTESNVEFLKRIAKSLGSSELCEIVKEFITEGEALSSSNVLERLSLCESLEVSGSRELDYLSAHFYEIDKSVLQELRHDDLKKVIESEQLRLFSEDALLDLILELGAEYSDLLGCVQTEHLSRTGMSRLLDSVPREQMDDALWQSLCRRLLLFVPAARLAAFRFPMRECRFDSAHPFRGILAQLCSECGGNAHTHEIVSITASTNRRNACHQVIDYGWNDFWYTLDAENSWIQFDFKERRISPTHYTLRSDGDNRDHLLKWSLEGTNDGTTWVSLDQRETNDLNGNYIVRSYECASAKSASFRFIRLLQTGANSSGRGCLQLANLEFFGILNESESASH